MAFRGGLAWGLGLDGFSRWHRTLLLACHRVSRPLVSGLGLWVDLRCLFGFCVYSPTSLLRILGIPSHRYKQHYGKTLGLKKKAEAKEEAVSKYKAKLFKQRAADQILAQQMDDQVR